MINPEEKLFSKYLKSRVMLVGFNNLEFKQVKSWFYEKHMTAVTEMRVTAEAWGKLEITPFHFIVIKLNNEENADFLAKLVESNRFLSTPIITFSLSPEVYANSYAKRDVIGKFCKLPVNIIQLEKAVLEILGTGVVQASHTSSIDGFLSSYSKANDLLDDGKGEEAVEELQKLLKENPQFFDGYMKMAEALISLNKHDEAKAVLEKGRALKPDSSKPDFLLGTAEFASGDLEKAKEHFNAALQKEPANVNLIMEIGNKYMEAGVFDEAMKYFNMAKEVSPLYLYVYNRMGIAQSRAGKFAEADESYKKALEIDKDDPGVHFNMGMMWHRQKNKEKAIECFKKCVELNPGMEVVEAANDMLIKLYEKDHHA